MKTIKAKYPGTCFECGQPFKAGDEIKYYGRHHCEHAKCSPDKKPDYDQIGAQGMEAACGIS